MHCVAGHKQASLIQNVHYIMHMRRTAYRNTQDTTYCKSRPTGRTGIDKLMLQQYFPCCITYHL